MKSLSDEKLMEILATNNDGQGRIALDCLYKRYSKPMLNFFYFSLQNDNEKAKDFVHDLFIRIIENKNKFNTKQQFKPWIYGIASNMCKNEYRSNTVIQKFRNHVTQSAEIIASEKENDLNNCICNLKQEHRSLIVMRFKLKLSISEMAAIYECPEGTIKSRLFYATKELSKIYKL